MTKLLRVPILLILICCVVLVGRTEEKELSVSQVSESPSLQQRLEKLGKRASSLKSPIKKCGLISLRSEEGDPLGLGGFYGTGKGNLLSNMEEVWTDLQPKFICFPRRTWDLSFSPIKPVLLFLQRRPM